MRTLVSNSKIKQIDFEETALCAKPEPQVSFLVHWNVV